MYESSHHGLVTELIDLAEPALVKEAGLIQLTHNLENRRGLLPVEYTSNDVCAKWLTHSALNFSSLS